MPSCQHGISSETAFCPTQVTITAFAMLAHLYLIRRASMLHLRSHFAISSFPAFRSKIQYNWSCADAVGKLLVLPVVRCSMCLKNYQPAPGVSNHCIASSPLLLLSSAAT
jgi:hypothetical protein